MGRRVVLFELSGCRCIGTVLTLAGSLFFGPGFSPVFRLRPAALIESELIAKTAPAMGAVFLCAAASPDSSQSGKNHPGVTYHCIAIAGHICGRRVLHQLGFFRAQCIQCR